MKSQYQISFIICTYNSKTEKVLKSINSISNQKDLKYEIILCDDGSSHIEKNILIDTLNKNNINYVTVFNEKNRGTIRNLLSGLYQAEGEYVFCIGPGDLIFDKYVGKRMYNYAKENELKMVFGNAVPYEYTNKIIIHTEVNNSPKFPGEFAFDKSIYKKLKYSGLCFPINGTCFLREKQLFIQLLEEVSDYIKYKEDYSTTLLALLKGVDIVYFDCNTTWYEYKTGVSTGSNDGFRVILYDEDKEIINYLLSKYGHNKYLIFCKDFTMMLKKYPAKKEILKCFFKHPVLFLKRLYYSRIKRNIKVVTIEKDDKVYLNRLLT